MDHPKWTYISMPFSSMQAKLERRKLPRVRLIVRPPQGDHSLPTALKRRRRPTTRIPSSSPSPAPEKRRRIVRLLLPKRPRSRSPLVFERSPPLLSGTYTRDTARDGTPLPSGHLDSDVLSSPELTLLYPEREDYHLHM